VLGGQQPHQLAHEVGVALGLAVEGGHQVGRRVDPGHVGDEPAHLALVEAAEGQARGHRLAEQLGQGAAQAVTAVHLDVAVGADQQQARVGQLPRHELQQQQAGPVRPVEVVEDHHQAGVGRRFAQRRRHGVEQAEAGHLGVELGSRHRAGGGLRQLGQRRPPGPVGGRPLGLVAAAPHHPDLPGPGLGGELLGDAGLADAGLAGDEHELPLPAEGAVERGTEPGPLGVAADQGDLVGMLGALRHHRRGSGQIGMHQREDVLGPGQPPQVVRAHVHQAGPVRQLVGHQLGRGPGQQHLPALPERPQPRGAVERLAVVVAVAQLRLAGVQRGPGRELQATRPAPGAELPLEGQGRGRGVARPREHRHRRVALATGLDEAPVVGGDGPGDELLVLGQRDAHRRPVPLPQRRGPLDVGQQEGEDAIREPVTVRTAPHAATPGRGSPGASSSKGPRTLHPCRAAQPAGRTTRRASGSAGPAGLPWPPRPMPGRSAVW
jgi:hypothetical protein